MPAPPAADGGDTRAEAVGGGAASPERVGGRAAAPSVGEPGAADGVSRAGGGPAGPRGSVPRAVRLLALARLGLLGLIVVALFVGAATVFGLSSERVRDAVDGVGPLAPLAFVVVSAALTVACVPGPLLAGAAGLLFGTALGTPTAIVAATLGATAAATLSRRLGAGALDELSGRRLTLLQAWLARRGFLAVLTARLLPGIPYNLVNYAAGLTRIPLAVFALATAIGCAPRAFAYVALGGSLDDIRSPQALIAFGVLVAMAVAGVAVAARDWRVTRR